MTLPFAFAADTEEQTAFLRGGLFVTVVVRGFVGLATEVLRKNHVRGGVSVTAFDALRERSRETRPIRNWFTFGWTASFAGVPSVENGWNRSRRVGIASVFTLAGLGRRILRPGRSLREGRQRSAL